MNLEPAPRLNKVPFFLTAAGCVIVVVLIGLFAPNKFAPLPFLTAVGFLIVSITAIMIPILIEYAADSAEYVQQERARVSDQVQRLHAAGESLARAAAQIKAVEEAVHKTAHAAENLPYRMQEKLAEFNETLAGKEDEDRAALEQELAELRATNSGQLKAVAEKIHQITGEWTALETTSRKHFATAEATAAKLQDKLQATLARLDSRMGELDQAAVQPADIAPALPPPAPAKAGTPSPELPVVEPEPAAEVLPPAAVVEEPKPRKPRAPRKPKTEDSGATGESSAVPDAPVVVTDHTTAPDEPPAEAPATTEAAASSDGATRLLATAYIGIGNKLYIRGDGPGLSWDQGVAMQFVSIGKWGWATHEATGPVACKLYKNDETAALSGEISLEPGKHAEVTALF